MRIGAKTTREPTKTVKKQKRTNTETNSTENLFCDLKSLISFL